MEIPTKRKRTTMKTTVRSALLLCFLTVSSLSYADSIVLGTSASFAVLGASTVTNTGNSVLNGNLGLYPGTSITGFLAIDGGPGIVNGTIYKNDPAGVAMTAQADALTAYNSIAGLARTGTLTGVDLGGQELLPGVYFFATSAQLTGQLILNAEGLSDVNFVFQIGTTLTTASASSVLIINPGQNDNVFWDVGSSATLGTTTSLYGSILADQSITLNTGATSACGRCLALSAAVTLDDNTVSTDSCTSGTGSGGGGGGGGGGGTTTPEPSSVLLLASGLIVGAALIRRAGASV